ncbi:MAG TPA: AMP-binding protein [Acidobacteriota bacterium]|nr:AMP-binding protein [Acidobacteriota bacterium]
MNVADEFTCAAHCYPDKKALIFGDRHYTYAGMEKIIEGIAGYLSRLGVAGGDRVAIYMPNRPEWIMFYYAVARIGAVSVCVPAVYKKRETAGIIRDSRSSVIVTSELLGAQLPSSEEAPLLRHTITIEWDDALQALLRGEAASGMTLPYAKTSGDDTAAILYTGGTTGDPKGAMLTHRNLLYSAQNVAYHERMLPSDIGICFLPLNHVFAQCHIMHTFFSGCGTLILFPGFDMDGILEAVNKHEVTRLYAVPTVFIRFLNNPASRKHLESLRYVFSGGTSMPAEIVRQWVNMFGIPIHEAYGMTETASIVTFNHLFRHKIGSIGMPAGVIELKVVDGNDNEMPRGERGEIIIRGPNIMKGYFEQPEETSLVMRNGWLHSGDVGVFDEEGYLYIVDRIKDIVITGGENVFPKEVEDMLHQHEAVNECGVVGLPHKEYGEAVTAFVTVKPNMHVDEKTLIAFCKERIAAYKAPKKIFFVDDLPKTPQGKILRRELRKL